MKGKRVCITGATGFLGGALARALAQEGAEIHALARPTGNRGVLADVPVTWHEGDITVPETLKHFLTGASYVIHAAGRLGKAGKPETQYQLPNIDGTQNVLAAALAAGTVSRFLYLSTAGVLGPTPDGPAKEDAPYAPSSAYERSKAAAEQAARQVAHCGLAVVIVRPGLVYGPGDRHVLGLFRAIQRHQFFYIGGGRYLCHPTYIADAVAGMLLCLSRGRTGEAYHIAGPSPATFRELSGKIAAVLGVPAPWLSLPRWLAMSGAVAAEMLGRVTGWTPPLSRTGVAFFTEDRAFSWQRAHEELGYMPQHDLTMGVTETVAWYRQKGWL